MTLEDAKTRMNAQAANLASLVRAGHITYVGAEHSIAAYAESLLPPNGPDYGAAWDLYDYGIQQFRAHGKQPLNQLHGRELDGSARGSSPNGSSRPDNPRLATGEPEQAPEGVTGISCPTRSKE